jgi:hypothetical protein
VFIDINDVLVPVLETINFFRKLNAESPQGESAGRIEATIKLELGGKELLLTSWAEIKLGMARFRGHEGGVRFSCSMISTSC